MSSSTLSIPRVKGIYIIITIPLIYPHFGSFLEYFEKLGGKGKLSREGGNICYERGCTPLMLSPIL